MLTKIYVENSICEFPILSAHFNMHSVKITYYDYNYKKEVSTLITKIHYENLERKFVRR